MRFLDIIVAAGILGLGLGCGRSPGPVLPSSGFYQLHGVVLDSADAHPLAQSEVRFDLLDGCFNCGWPWHYRTVTDSQGNFSIALPRLGRLCAHAFALSYTPAAVLLEMPRDSARTLTIRLQLGVRWRDGLPPCRAAV